jgi:hypothetical protein
MGLHIFENAAEREAREITEANNLGQADASAELGGISRFFHQFGMSDAQKEAYAAGEANTEQQLKDK